MTETGEVLAALGRAVLEGDDQTVVVLARRALDSGLAPLETIERGLVPGIRRAGELWDEGEYFLPELVSSAQAMKAAMDVVRPALARHGGGREIGRVVIGTVHGDIHDIGKTLVGTLLAANGFSVTDEGADVPLDRFVARARELDADLVCASALLTTTMAEQRELVSALRREGLRARVMVGGAPASQEWANEIGAHGYADNAVAAVAVAHRLVTGEA
ncbi:MAG TPA: corrinoid protein [Thermoanaerobaculaceae bacterium]|nr:corrinoid protein [Thermoanaerobaculaceae bacterium]